MERTEKSWFSFYFSKFKVSNLPSISSCFRVKFLRRNLNASNENLMDATDCGGKLLERLTKKTTYSHVFVDKNYMKWCLLLLSVDWVFFHLQVRLGQGRVFYIFDRRSDPLLIFEVMIFKLNLFDKGIKNPFSIE